MGCGGSSSSVTSNPIPIAKSSEPKAKVTPTRVTNDDQVFLELKSKIRKVKEDVKLMENKIENAKKNALINLQKQDKKRALLALKLKRLYEATLDKNYGTILMLETAEQNLRGAKQDSEIYKVMKTANDLTAELQSKVSISDFEKLSDDLEERKEENQKIQQFFSEMNVDDTDILEELNNLDKVPATEENASNIVKKLDKREKRTVINQNQHNQMGNKSQYPSSKKEEEKIAVMA